MVGSETDDIMAVFHFHVEEVLPVITTDGVPQALGERYIAVSGGSVFHAQGEHD